MRPSSPQVAASKLLKLSSLRPQLAFVLGSGFELPTEVLQTEVRIPYRRIPGFPPVGVGGHAGEVVIGLLGGVPVMILRGRAHFYEGHSMSQVTFGVRTAAALGVKVLVLTNAAGGINPKFRPGDLMVIKDHINLMGVNPLRGFRAPDGSRFVDLSRVYDPGLNRLLVRAAKAAGLKAWTGVYLAVSGPSYETPAEITAFRKLGADAVGMSTVPEAIVARQCGLKVAALSCITNLAAGLSRRDLTHTEVLKRACSISKAAGQMLCQFAEDHARTKIRIENLPRLCKLNCGIS